MNLIQAAIHRPIAVIAVVIMVIMSVRPFREWANSPETEAGASGLDAPPEFGVRQVMMEW